MSLQNAVTKTNVCAATCGSMAIERVRDYIRGIYYNINFNNIIKKKDLYFYIDRYHTKVLTKFYMFYANTSKN